MKILYLFSIICISFTLTACADDSFKMTSSAQEKNKENIIDEEIQEIEKPSLSSSQIKELVSKLSNGEIEGKQASINSNQIVIVDDLDEETTDFIDIEQEDFFVAIAPYINTTQSCTEYNLTEAIGELKEVDFEVKVADLDGEVYIEETMKSEKNGFLNLWLPRYKKFIVLIKYGDKATEVIVSTYEEDISCISVVKLN